MQGIQNNQMASMEDANVIKVGRYSVEERKDRILRYLKKKNQRNFNKTIKVFIFIFSHKQLLFFFLLNNSLRSIIYYTVCMSQNPSRPPGTCPWEIREE